MAEPPLPRKFMFEQSFDAAAVVSRAAERKPVLMKPEQVDALKKESYDAGHVAGMQSSADDQAKWLAGVLTRIEERLNRMTSNMEDLHKKMESNTRDTVLAIARKILPDFTAKGGLQEIEALLAAAITEMAHEPRLVVRIHESQFDAVNAKIQEITAQKAYSGKVVVLADAAIAAGDCRVEWADGGIERNAAETMKAIETIVAPDGAAEPKPQE